MSTLPGRDAWRDAGLDEPDRRDREVREADPDDTTLDDAANLVDEALADRSSVSADSAEDYRPGVPRPDLDGQADEADVAEQAEEVPGLTDEDAYAAAEPAPDTPDDDGEG